MQLSIIFIWGTFALTFLLLGYFHWKMASKRISHFSVKERPMMQMEGIVVTAKIGGANVDEPLKNFISDFNRYINTYNQTSKNQNKAQAFGYLIACFAAIASLAATVLS